ncbi:PrgI family protein [Candidatus Saccharibacteria bacterium]|nr:PrgI family protein [Candidatus Saccharibacteria bacterium]
MAVYKVAQDVEADDKLIGPFSFRQFIYLIIVALAMALAWGLSRIFAPLAIIPVPVIIFFGALALPLRKDQPMEVYLAALVSFYLKPRRRLWVPDGIESLVQITTPKVVEIQRTKDITQTEAERRLSYLADIADTQGWAVRQAAQPTVNNAMFTDAYFAAQQTEDILDDNGGIASNIDAMISQADERHKQEILARMHNPIPAQPVAAQPAVQPIITPPVTSSAQLQYNPYPTEIHQAVINPLTAAGQLSQPAPAEPVATQPAVETIIEPVSTSENTVSPDIINLASNTDLSIETMQREAGRIQRKHDDEGEEVLIKLH